MTQEELFKKLIAHCKEYGFIFPSSEIYDGLSAVYDYGQLGVELKNNIKTYWWDSMTKLHDNIVGIDAAIFMHPRVWVLRTPLLTSLCSMITWPRLRRKASCS